MNFIYPWLLTTIIPATAVLLLAYRNKQAGNKFKLGSLLLLNKLTKKPTTKKKRVFPLRFFIELVIFIISTLLLAGLIFIAPPNNVAILIDNSESMSTISTNGEEKIKLAINYATNWLDLLPSNSNVDIYTTDLTPKKINSEILSKNTAKREISTIKTVAAEENLNVATNLILSSAKYDNMLVLSDHVIEIPERDSLKFKIETYTVEHTTSYLNATISKMNLTNSDNNQNMIEVYINLSAKIATKGTVNLYGYNLLEGSISSIISSQTANLSLAKTNILKFFDPQNFDAYVAELKVENDMLIADNFSVVGLDNKELVVGIDSPYSIRSLNLPSLPNMSYVKSDGTSLHNDIKIIHKSKADPLKDESTVNSPLFIISPEFEKNSFRNYMGKIISHKESHPILDYIDIRNIEIKNTFLLAANNWSESIININEGSIANAGYINGYPVVILGFDIFPLKGKQTAVSSILFLNTLKWISDFTKTSALSRFAPGATFSRQNNNFTSFFSLNDKSLSAVTSEQLPSERGIAISKEEDKMKIFPVNFYSIKESTAPTKAVLNLTEHDLNNNKSQNHKDNIITMLYILLFLLLADFLAVLFKPRYA